MDEQLKQQVIDLVNDSEYSGELIGDIKESEVGEWLKDDTVYNLENAFDVEPENLAPIALDYSNNYWADYHEYYNYNQIPEDSFKIWLTWAFTTYMRKCIVEYEARHSAYNYSADIEDRFERNRVYDHVLSDELGKSLNIDENLKAVFSLYSENKTDNISNNK